MQIDLSRLGLSSLGRLEAHVMAGIESVILALHQMSEKPLKPINRKKRPLNFKDGDLLLQRHTNELLGPLSSDRIVRFMITLPRETANDYGLILSLMKSGMNIVWINSAHDDMSIWKKMVANVRKAERELNHSCKILFDLGGPKLHTGNIKPSPQVIRIRPQKDERGNIVNPARVWLGLKSMDADDKPDSTFVPVDESFFDVLQAGDRIEFVDIQGRKRKFNIIDSTVHGALAECPRNAYLEPGLKLKLVRRKTGVAKGEVGSLPNIIPFIWLLEGDMLHLIKGSMGETATRDHKGKIIKPAKLPCTLPEVFSDIQVGDPILFDDGKFEGSIKEVNSDLINIKITRTLPGGAKLRSDKGINLPNTDLSSSALSHQDLHNLDFAVKYTDLIGLSFVRKPSDIHLLYRELEKGKAKKIGVVLKIENQIACDNLSELLLSGLQYPPFGVMVARGDLGVEIGFDKLAEVQEQILWLCEAAHVPVIWATQVLENLIKKGIQSRAEAADASMSARAECVMLNKGPYIAKAINFLDKILTNMREHHYKKTPILRKLKVSEGRFSD